MANKAPSTNSLIVMVIVGVLVGWLVGFAVGNSVATSDSGSDSEQEIEEVNYSGDAEVNVGAAEDSMGGYNVSISTENFTFTPNNAGGKNVENQGHAHIYVDGKKVGRVYGDWYYLPALEEGEHTITVALTNNDHTPVVVDGQEVEASIDVISGEAEDHSHSADEAEPHSH